MTQKEKDRLQYMIDVMQAFADGKEIEYRHGIDCVWCTLRISNPSWNWADCDYRVKLEPPKPKYRPFENAEEVMEAIKEHGDWLRASDGSYAAIVNVLKDRRLFLGEYISSCSYNYVLKENYTFADGTPFGKLIEE